MKKKSYLFLQIISLIFFLLPGFSVNGQDKDGYTQVRRFKHYTSKDGLPQNSVLAITQDNLGYLWFGTDDGLARFDGYQFRIFRHDPENINSLSNNVIRALHVDPFGKIWIGTEGGGINIYDPISERFSVFGKLNEGFYSKKISSITKGSNGQLWIGTNGAGLFKISGFDALNKDLGPEDYEEKLKIQHYQKNNSSLEDDKIWKIYEDSDQNIWVGSLEGGAFILPLNHPTDSLKKVDFGLDIRSIKSFHEDQFGHFWIGTEKNGVFIRRKGESTFSKFNLPQQKNSFQQKELNITGFWEDRMGNLWIGTLGQGLFISQESTNTIYHYEDQPSDPYSLNGNSVYTLYEDRSGNMWMGMYSGEGLNKTNSNNQQFEHFTYDPNLQKGLSGKMVKTIFKDQKENLWIGLFNGGLNYMPKGAEKFQYFSANGTGRLSHNHIQTIFQTKDQKIWIGTDGGGINVYDPIADSFEYYQNKPGDSQSLSKNEIWAIAQDLDEKVWIGSANGGGLDQFNPKTKTFRHYPIDLEGKIGPSFPDIRSLLVDSKNNLWIGTYGGGLNKMDLQNQVFTHYNQNEKSPFSISHPIITAIVEDRHGYIWVGTFGGGLNRINPIDESVKVYREKDGLPSDVIKAILEDKSGQLWISTVNGLSSLDKQSETFKNYMLEDGLQSDEFNLGAAFKDREGRLYFGGTNGYNSFFPERIKPNPPPNVPIITTLKVLNEEILPNKPFLEKYLLKQSISFTEHITLTHQDNSFELEFSALEFSGQDNLKYAYMLEGFDQEWIVTDSKRRFAPYANLKPGNYLFKVKTVHDNNSGNEEVRLLKLSVLPPWYNSFLARLIYGLLLVITLYGIKSLVFWRIKLRNDLRYERLEKQKQEEVNQLKLRFFTNISHELRTPLMLIKAPLETLSLRSDLPKSVSHQLESIHANAIRLLRLINQLLDFRKQETGHLQLNVKKVDVRQYMDQIFKAFEVVALQKSINFQIIEEDDVPSIMWFDPDQIEKVFFNLIYNSFKFTPDGGKICIRLKNTSFIPDGNLNSVEALAFEIKDNGKGILPQHTEKVFERFFQINQDNNYQNVGTGIGLALSKNLVDFHKGAITVTSIPEVKTIFTVILRKGFEHYSKHELLQHAEEQKTKTWLSEEILALRDKTSLQNAEMDNQSTLTEKNPKRILIVEDNVELLDLLSRGLENNFHVITAKNGQEGLDKLGSEKPDLVISDVMMPIMDGIELCGRIRQNIETSHIPIILLTAKSSHIHQLEGYESGADDYITKPFPLDLLQLKIRNLLDGRERFQEQFKTSPNLEPSRIKVSSADEKLLQLAIHSVEKNIDNNEYTINDLVKDLGLSRTIAFEKFKALIGQTPNDFIQMIRLKRAAQLILETDLKFSEVGYMVGFSNPKYFSKCFQKQFGYTPTEYKKK